MSVDTKKLRKLYDASTSGEWAEDDCNVFSRVLSDARHNAILAKCTGKQYDEHALKLDAFIATTEQRHSQSDADAIWIAEAHNAFGKMLDEIESLRAQLAAQKPKRKR